MGALRTSEEGGEVVGGEAKSVKSDENRSVDAPGRIIIDSAPAVTTAATTAAAAPKPLPQPIPPMPQPRSGGGLGLVIVVYLLAAGALAAAIYERFFMR